MNWFQVDKSGLAAILERRGKFFAIAELVSNAWDSGATKVEVVLEPIEGKPFASILVRDNGSGFADLSHANTMFARSSRAADPVKRGRFNLGEKLVLSICRWAAIATTSGTLNFTEAGNVVKSKGIAEGTIFEAELRMSRSELEDVSAAIRNLIPPVETTFNGVPLDRPDSICTFAAKLPTELADADGMIRRSTRLATVEVYADEYGTGEIFEMGIPVVETDNGYRLNVLQKVPLNMERDNVTPAFLKALQTALLNNIADQLTPDQAVQTWVQEAAGDARATAESVKHVVSKRFGENAVIANPTDPIANAKAAAMGYTVVSGGSMSGDMWANVRKANILLPSSKVCPTPKPEEMAASAESKCPLCGR